MRRACAAVLSHVVTQISGIDMRPEPVLTWLPLFVRSPWRNAVDLALLRESKGVQTQQGRDDKTVAIATGLGLFGLILAVALVAVAVLALVRYLVVSGKR
jgi:hypothetical protein